MDIGKINSNFAKNIIDSTKSKVAESSFEKHLQGAMEKNDEKELKKVCQDFEAFFLNMMYKQMKAAVPKSNFIPEDSGRDIFESMHDESLMEEASKSGSFGLADSLYNQLSKRLKNTHKTVSEGEKQIVRE